MTSLVGVLHPLRLWASAGKQRAARLWRQTSGVPIFTRIAIGNSLIILLGALGGTLIIHSTTERGAELVSILLFAVGGVVISILLNLYIVRAALSPLRQLSQVVAQITRLPIQDLEISLNNPDPDTARLAASLRTLIEQLEARNQQLQLLSTRAIHLQEEERLRIARSLHDDTGQALISLKFTLESLEKHLPAHETALQEQIQAALSVAAEALGSLRRVIHDLRPAVLDDLGLVSATRWYARSKLEPAGVQVDFHCQSESLPLTPELNLTLFRIAQEAINNISRHARASKAWIRLGLEDSQVYLDIQDDGIGFKVAKNSHEAMRLNHWGLAGIQERLDLVQGTLRLESTPGNGTHLHVCAPLSAAQGAPDG